MKKITILVLLVAMAITVVRPSVIKAEEENTGNNTTAVADTSSIDTSDCDEECQKKKEIETEVKNTKTGSFAPYAVVIGGIVFSVASIALARKNNKLYQV